jgi:hypothetical protein
VGATKICCDQQMSDAEVCQRYGLLGEAAMGATKICCDQQMLDAEVCGQRYGLLGEAAVELGARRRLGFGVVLRMRRTAFVVVWLTIH